MKTGTVPHIDQPVARILIGGMYFRQASQELAFEVYDEFRRLGGNCVDFAHCYGPEHHQVAGEYLQSRGRDSFLIFDKGCHPYKGQNRVTREAMASDIKENLERLQVDYVDFFTLHRDDSSVPAGEVIEWLNEHKAAGRVRAFGGSNWHHTRLEEANEYAEKHGLQGFSVSSPNRCLAKVNEPMWPDCLTLDDEEVAWYTKTQFPVFSWSSGASGYFAGVDNDDIRRVYENPISSARRERARLLADTLEATPAQIAIAWVLHDSTNAWAIVGPKNVAELKDCIAASQINLTADQVRYLTVGPA